ncbi:MAG TPA: IgGFc-binding protein, partial [Polyangia bacterium]|nr:IgGFc-binding protein [Polyangia bacterium]
ADADADADADGDTDTEYTGPVIPPTCADAAAAKTSVGCVFFTADLDNWDECDSQTFAIVVSNPHEDQNAEVTLEHGLEGAIYGVTLTPGQLHVINVACSSGCLIAPQQIERQGIAINGGFRLTADVPILAYQWNPYGLELYSTDASLLIPTTSLDGTYIVAAWGTGPGASWQQLRSQVTVVASADDTHVSFIPSVGVAAMGGVGPFTAGVESTTYTLGAYDVIAFEAGVIDQDVTGTVVLADKPVAVFGGHSCANVPSGMYAACDHVEEQLLPLAAWGTETVLARHAPRSTCSATTDTVVWRVIAGADDMTVTFDPPAPSPAGASYDFSQQGQLLEFISGEDHFAVGTLNNPPDPEEPEGPFFANQVMTGCTYANCGSSEGDPMMLQSPPAGQFLDRYVFNTDNVFDFDYDHIIVVRPTGIAVELDCMGVLPDTGFTAVGSSDWEVGRFFIDDPGNTTGCLDGAHVLIADDQVGLSVVGTADANSYGYLAGVGVRAINPVPVVE